MMNPDSQWPLPVPPPYRYYGAGIAFGLLGIVGDIFNPKIATVIAVGLFIGLAFQTTQTVTKKNSSSGSTGHWWDPVTPDIPSVGEGAGGPISGTTPAT
jgi:hypothetical protein